MNAFPIRNEEDLHRATELVDALWDAEPGTPEHDVLLVMAQLIDAYEAAHSTLPAADPIELLRFKLKETGWSQRELARRLGWGSGRVSEILSRKRRLTLELVRQLSQVFDLPPGALVHEEGEAGGGLWVHVTGRVATVIAANAQQRRLAPGAVVMEWLEAQARMSTGWPNVEACASSGPIRPGAPPANSVFTAPREKVAA